ncbi:glycoside hydrolase family 32 protein [Novosphingobium sp.]|uniref:glycoside hydrolase family 32 protein n=1 Tax=Novosphingobium sp. TaxID=1874826 RepID=UPI0038BBD4BA
MHPRYHYAPVRNWLSDPNGLVHDGTHWHMAYQYNPHGEEWGHMAWGHAVSADLAHWQERAPALVEEAGVMVFSGSAVVDRADSAGFGKDAIVAIWTGADIPHQRQSQCLAFSTDKGATWTKYPGNPVLDIGLADFRDPNVFWHAATARWVMIVVLSTENRAAIYSSPDLKAWTLQSHVPTLDAPGHLWECPLLIELPIEGESASRWLFKVDVLSGAPGSGALYLTGTFDGAAFTPDGPWQLADAGSDFYAAIAWHEPRDERGRPCWIGWMGNHAYQKHLPLQGWRGAMSVPRRLSLVRREGALVLRQDMEPSTVRRFGPDAPLTLSLAAQTTPLASRIAIADTGAWSLEIGAADGRHLLIERDHGKVSVARHDPVTPELDGRWEAPIATRAALTLWLDVGSIELLDATGALSLTLQHRLGGPGVYLRTDRPLPVGLSAL